MTSKAGQAGPSDGCEEGGAGLGAACASAFASVASFAPRSKFVYYLGFGHHCADRVTG